MAKSKKRPQASAGRVPWDSAHEDAYEQLLGEYMDACETCATYHAGIRDEFETEEDFLDDLEATIETEQWTTDPDYACQVLLATDHRAAFSETLTPAEQAEYVKDDPGVLIEVMATYAMYEDVCDLLRDKGALSVH